MAHGSCRPAAAACACTGGGSQSNCAFRGAAATASLRRSIGASADANRITVYAFRTRELSAERSTTAAAPIAFGLPGAHARLRARMAESEGNGPGSRQDLVRIRPGLSREVNLRRFGPGEQPRAPTGRNLYGFRLRGNPRRGVPRRSQSRRARKLALCRARAPLLPRMDPPDAKARLVVDDAGDEMGANRRG